MHALAALLHNRVKDNMQSLGNVETKLLYTLHWILLDASDECIESDYENGIFYSNPFHYLFSIPALTLFVFLFAPLSHHLKESDFTNNYRLENGLKMWQAMWEFRHPEAPCFTTLVKPKPKPLGGKYSKRHQPGDVFMGRKLSKEEGGGGNVTGSPPSQNVSMSQSEVTSKQASTEEEPWLSSPKDTIFPETIPEESSSTEEEHVFIYRLPSEQNFGGAVKEAYTVYSADPSIFQLRKTDPSKPGLPGIKPLPQITKMSSSDKESLSDSGGGGGGPTKGTPTSAEKAPTAKQGNVSAATFLDVATMRCLFTSQWQEEGVYWALHYLYNRLRDICDDMSKQTQPRKRSNSLPIPKIEVSVYQSPDIKDRDSLKNFIEVPEVKDMSPITEMPFASPPKPEEENVMMRRSSEKIKKKMKMADLKAFVETKLLSKSEKALEKIGHDEHKTFSFHSAEYHRSLDNTDDRPNSALASNFPPIAPRLTGDLFHCNLIKGKSMPSLRYIDEVRTERTQGPSNTMPTNVQKKKNPIITVTEHTPTPSPDYLSKTRQGSLESQIDSVSMQGSQHIPTPERKPSLTRSQTDSNITYVVEEIQEAPGSLHYITKDGDIDFQVVLKAVYSVSTMDSFYITLRVMEVMLNLVDTLMEMGVHKNWQNTKNDEAQPGNVDPMADFNKDKDSKERDSGIPCAQSQDSTNVEGGDSTKEKTREEDNLDCPYYMIMHVILRLLRQLGCSHGCTTALRGPQAECLRVQARNSLRQLRSASIPKFTARLKEMTKYSPIREVLDNLHAAVGFCAEPSTLVSPMNQQKRSFTKSPDITNLQSGYASNFGAGQGPNASRAIETFIIETTFRVLVTRFALMHKELKMLDNSTLYMEVRLLLSYVREAHGGEFRVVAFSALMDTAERPDSQLKESNMQTTRVIRHIPRQSEEERNSDTGADSGCAPDERSHKKFTFKKRSTSSTGAHSLLETEGGEESASQSPLSVRTRRYQLTPRQSERTIPSASSADITPHHKISHSKSIPSKFHIAGIVNWFRQKPHHSQSLIRNGGGSGESLPISGSMISLARPPHMPPPHTSRPVHVKRRVGYTLNRARKRVEDRLNRFGLRKMGKKRDGSIEDTSGGYMSRRGSAEGGSGGGESEVVILKRRRLVAAAALYAGLARFNFLLDATQPGGTPDALFMAALLDLPHTVVVGRAAILLECAHLVHNCNKGQWPYWLKSNTSKAAVSLNPQLKRQRLAGKLFYQWAEAIGNRLEEMLIEDKKHIDTVVNLVNDPDGQRELLQQDEEEDFLDEGIPKNSLLETEGGEESASQSPLSVRTRRYQLTPRQSERTIPSASSADITPHHKISHSKSIPSKFHIAGIVNWFRQKPHHSQSLIRNGGGSGESLPISGSMISLARPPHMPPPHTSRPVHVKRRVGYTLNRARKRVEDRLNRFGLRKMGKKRDGSIEDTSGGYMSRRGSAEGGSGGGESEVVILKRRRLVAAAALYAGLARFNFLLDATQPGGTPDALFMAALLDLPHTVVVGRAAILLECAHLVHNCNKGQWPYWLKSNTSKAAVSLNPQLKRQRLAGKLFYQWAEAIGNRLEEMLIEDKKHIDTVVNLVNDPDGQRELLQQDEEEDFLDEASIRLPGKPVGAECPRALRIIACVLLFEITAFLRETYQNLPKTCRSSLKERGPWDRVYREANRRWSMALSSMGHSQASAQSLQSIAGAETERKISFVLHEPENVSGGSNVTLADAIPPAVDDKKGRLGSRGKAGMHRRNTQQTHSAYGSFKRRSIKLRQKDTRDVVDEFVTRRSDSIQSRRKVSSLSDRSDTSEVYPGAGGTVIMSNEVDSGGEESPGVLSDDHDHPPDSPDSNSTDPPDTNKGFPWLKVMVKFLNSFNYVCCHQNFCHPYCFRRNMRASVRLMKSVQKIYGEKFGPEINTTSSDEGNGGTRRGRRSRKSSEHSTDRIERSVIESAGLAYRAAGGEQSNIASEGVPSKPAAVPYPPVDPPPILKYLKGQVRDAYHTPLATLIKGATTMGEDMFAECAPVAWQLLLESDRELSSCAAALFILAAVKAPATATEIMHNDLKHSEPSTRINAILRFQVMWKLRYQVWPRMEEGASVTFKVPPPGIEFTLPSPKIGIESLAVVDPPWTPQVKDKDMEMTLNQERHRSLVTATKTRKKQQTEAIKRALQQRNDKKRAERESFLITTIPITRQAAREPALDHAADDHVEPPADEELVEGVRGSHHTQVASALFPSTLCSAVAEIVSLLDDAAVSRDGCSVYEVAYQVIWCCLVEDSALFLRHVLERLTRDHQDEMFKLLRHLIRFIPRLPQQAAFALYNYIIGYVMFYVRSPHEEGQRLVGAALSILWMVVHSVHGIMFKDLKQILRKEQCDASILLTANVPAAKKIIVHGPPDNEGCIPSQFPVQEDTVFAQILKESLDFFGIPEKLHREHFLVDFKTRQIHNPQGYVRDHYFFKRSQYPQLGLVHMEPDEAFQKLQEQELLQKFVEIGKVLLTWAILKNVDMVVQRVVFLHDELMKLPSFPRKALEADLVLYSRGALGSTLLGLDVLHKFMWVRLIARMFEAMAGNFTSSRDIHLFLNVLNGALMLHSEDSLILRYVIATYVNAAFNFKSIFSTNGYLLIMPTLLQIYSNFQTNKLVTTTIEYAVKQFYLLNRKPFILQMFGSVSAILDTDEESTYGDASKVQSSCLFNLLLSLETPSPDPLHIAELIKEEKPLKPIDFCYRDEEEMVNVLDCISLCVMVVSYSAESMRGYQMLIILEAILPCYVKQIQLPTYNREGKTEKEIIQQLAIAIKTLVNNCEGLSKSYNGPYRTSPEHKGSSQRTGPRTAAATIIAFEESHSKYDNSKMPVPEYTGAEDSELVRAEYRRPRDVLLSLVGEFIGRATTRLLEINGSNRSGGTEGKPVELLDSKSHARLAEIAHSLLKVSPYDPESMGCRGLQRYMTQVLPAADWADDALRPALIMILRRLDKVFLKIAKKPSIRRNTDWDSAAVLLKGVYETMIRCPYIMHWQHVKTLLNTVQALIVSDNNCGENLSSATAALMSQPPPPHFCSTVVRLIALQIINTGDSYSLEQMCGGSASFPTGEKTENMLMNLFMPLCLRVGSGRKDVPPLRQSDVSYLVSVVLNALCPPAPPGQLAAVNAKLNASDNRANSLTFTGSRDTRNTTRLSNQLYRIAFLALKVMCACFTSELCTEWGRIARAMRDLGRRNEAAHHLWDFLEHVVTYRTPLYILLQPFIVHKLSQPPIGDNERHMQFAGGKRASEVFPRTTTVPDKHQQHRPSLISMLVGRGGTGGLPRTPDHPSAPLSAQRESLSSSSTTSQHMPTFEAQLNSGRMSDTSNNNNSSGNSHIGSLNNYGSDKPTASTPSYTSTQTKLRFVPSVELKFTSGETSMSPLSPMSPGEASCGECVPARGDADALPPDRPDTPDAGDRPRLQRAHGPSKKTFKFRRSRHTKPDVSHVRLESDDGSSPGPESTPLRRAWSQPPFLQPSYINTDTSYDSEISQTSSTSGYRLALPNLQ
uniref:Uncharacterized protein n=1 Tax=Heliothis virescens TaxID=7102 RepID=A0A2A4JBF5_HELVI